MEKIRTFFYIFKRSLGDSSYYHEITKTSLSFSLKYFAVLIFLLSFLFSFRAAVGLIPLAQDVPRLIEETKWRLENFYPEELVVTIENGIFSTNVTEPYFLDWPKKDLETLSQNEEPAHLIAIDTKTSVENYRQYDSIILITQKAVVFPGSSNQSSRKFFSFGEIKDRITLNRQTYLNLLRSYEPYLDDLKLGVWVLILGLISVAPFLLSGFVLINKLVHLLILSAPVWLILKLAKRRFGFGQVYRIGLHASTLPIIIFGIFSLLGINLPFPFLYSLILLFIMGLVSLRQNN